MNKKTKAIKNRNWAVVIMGSLIIATGLALLFLAIFYTQSLGWWSIVIGIGGLSSIFFAVMAIVKNDPAWILIDLLLP